MSNDKFLEKLEIKHFLSLENIILNIKPFMVITGDMGSGKSLLIKLLEFFETIFTRWLGSLYENFLDNLDFDNFCANTASKFKDRFHLDTELFDVSYRCSFGKTVLDIRLFRNKGDKDISMESGFLKKELPEWKKYCQSQNHETPDGRNTTKKEIYELLSKKFGGYYPIATTYVPAARATLAITELNKPGFWDYYLDEFNNLADFILKRNPNQEYENKIKDILKAKMKINGMIQLVSDDDRVVNLANASSGQQEVFYILLLLSRLSSFKYNYGKQYYIFMEEPETHLFPLEQKLALELICKIFNDNNYDVSELPIKFFITTHSPYVLNTINNMLLKGSIENKIFDNEKLKKYAERKLNDNKIKKIPNLDYEKTSVVFINKKGGADNILTKYKENYLIDPDEINKISIDIMDEYNFLDNLNDELRNKDD